VIPPFHSAVDRAISYLDPVNGLMGVADFFVSSKYDLPLRQMHWLTRFFWRCAAQGLGPAGCGTCNELHPACCSVALQLKPLTTVQWKSKSHEGFRTLKPQVTHCRGFQPHPDMALACSAIGVQA
jgi:hypothetical protein